MELGIGSRVEHPSFGRGVIVESSSEHYDIWFKNTDATKTLAKNYDERKGAQRTFGHT